MPRAPDNTGRVKRSNKAVIEMLQGNKLKTPNTRPGNLQIPILAK
jgi:hypothetical protein